MVKIVRGEDTNRLIKLELPEAVFLSDATIECVFGDFKLRTPARKEINITFPASWSCKQPIGRLMGTISLILPDGQKAIISNTLPIYLTDDISDVAANTIIKASPIIDFRDIDLVDAHSTPGDVKEVVNEILKRLKAGLGCLLALITLPVIGDARIATSVLDRIPGNATIVTNVTFEGLATTTSVSAAYRDALVATTNTVSEGWSEWTFRAGILPTPYEQELHVPFSEAFPTSTISIRYDPPDGYREGLWFIYFNGEMWGDMYGDENESYVVTDFNYVPGRGEVLFIAERHRIKKDALGLINAPMATNIARSVVNSAWDPILGVAWEARMHDGALYYVAVTNKPPEAK